ncbi:Rho GTPase activating protein 19, partial [Chelydra serpentina]
RMLGNPLILERKSRDSTPESERASKENLHLLQRPPESP